MINTISTYKKENETIELVLGNEIDILTKKLYFNKTKPIYKVKTSNGLFYFSIGEYISDSRFKIVNSLPDNELLTMMAIRTGNADCIYELNASKDLNKILLAIDNINKYNQSFYNLNHLKTLINQDEITESQNKLLAILAEKDCSFTKYVNNNNPIYNDLLLINAKKFPIFEDFVKSDNPIFVDVVLTYLDNKRMSAKQFQSIPKDIARYDEIAKKYVEKTGNIFLVEKIKDKELLKIAVAVEPDNIFIYKKYFTDQSKLFGGKSFLAELYKIALSKTTNIYDNYIKEYNFLNSFSSADKEDILTAYMNNKNSYYYIKYLPKDHPLYNELSIKSLNIEYIDKNIPNYYDVLKLAIKEHPNNINLISHKNPLYNELCKIAVEQDCYLLRQFEHNDNYAELVDVIIEKTNGNVFSIFNKKHKQYFEIIQKVVKKNGRKILDILSENDMDFTHDEIIHLCNLANIDNFHEFIISYYFNNENHKESYKILIKKNCNIFLYISERLSFYNQLKQLAEQLGYDKYFLIKKQVKKDNIINI